MSAETLSAAGAPLVLHMGPVLERLTEEEFLEFCRLNSELRIERTRAGDLLIMPPATGDGSYRNQRLSVQLGNWSERDGTGVDFDSSAGFLLPNGAMRSPDAAWVKRERWEALSPQEQDSFAPLVPDFVAELRSKTDRLSDLRAKMREYIQCGVRLAWLIDPKARRVEIYRPGQKPVLLEKPATLSGDPELAGFVVDLAKIWR